MSDSTPGDSHKEEGTPKGPNRRSMLLWMAAGAGATASAGLAVPIVGYLFSALARHERIWVPLGPATQFPQNQTTLARFDNPYRLPWDGPTGRSGAYVRNLGRDSQGNHLFHILAMNCAHLGCAVTWFPLSELFMCPCHGGVYYSNGERAAGPPPRGLYEMPWRVVNDQLEVQAPHLPTLQDTLKHPSDLVQLGRIHRDCNSKT
jgi:Rieske Fe-S protein